ncbi:NACHT, LRR and PYD domains-containing protein 13-like [Hypanus sabinus]|uniref:NACHT, LRR and PYD domains-containing protein 13-like n=1 Tax=Hypanus sabinus TaxID=79690 RepID=UPI0028C3C778|nr:NACHT, LRR and PYD domains-containing protein 13-like [Hypanus sabinus]
MRRCGNGFVLNSNLFMILMVTVLCTCTISKPRRDKYGANRGGHGGSDDLNKHELRSTGSITHQPPKVDEGYEEKSQKYECDNPKTGAGKETGKGSGGIADERGTEKKEKCPSGNESDITEQQNKTSEEDTANKAETRPAEDKHGAGNENEMKVTEKCNNDPEATVEQGHLGTGEDRRIIEEKAAVEPCQNIWMPVFFVISVIVGISAVGLLSSYWIRTKRFKLGNERAEGENDSTAGPDITDTGRPQTALSKAKKSARGILQYKYNLRDQSRKMKMPKLRLISDIYTDPLIILTPFEHEDEKGGSRNHVQEVQINELLKRNSSDSDKTSISVVYGAAGTGKTTLLQKIIHDWATGMKYHQFRFVLHFKIQNLNAIEGKITLSRLIIDAYPDLENYLDHLWMEPKRLLFIIDDLDQLHRPFIFSDVERNRDLQYRCTGPQSNCLVNDILRSLLQGQFLKGCSVLITSRLWKQETLHHVTVDSTLQVMGFTSEKVRAYFCRYLRHEQYAKCIVQFNEQNDILRNMCSSPLFCVTLASSLECHQPQREEETTMPVINHTQLLFDYVLLLLRACGYDDNTTKKCLIEVGALAYKAIRRNSLLFSMEADELSDLNLCPPNLTSTFMIQDTDKQSCGAVYGFRHSVVRDFLAAFANILCTPIPRLKGLLDETFLDTDGRFRSFLLFLVGLSSRNSIDRLKLEMGTDRFEVTSCISEWLTKNVKRRLMNMDGRSTQRTFLHTLYCLLEFGDNQITKEVLTPISAIKLNKLFLTSPDCTVLSRTLIYTEVIEELDLSSCLARPEEIKQLGHLLQKCVILRLNQNNLEDSGVKPLFNILKENDCKIQTLELRSNHLTDDCLQTLFSTLSTNHSVTQLNLSNSSQDEKHANQFSLESLHRHVDNYAQQKEIRWLRYEPVGQETASNVLILITD